MRHVQIRTRRFGFTVMTTGSQNPVGTCPQSLLQESRVSGCANVIHWNCMTCVTLPVLWPALNRDVMHRIIRTCSPCSIACHLAISVRSMPVTPGQEDPLQALCNPECTPVGKDPRRCQKKKIVLLLPKKTIRYVSPQSHNDRSFPNELQIQDQIFWLQTMPSRRVRFVTTAHDMPFWPLEFNWHFAILGMPGILPKTQCLVGAF